MIHKATNGYGVWYGSLDGETWVHFPCEPRPGDEAHITANIDHPGTPGVVFPGWQRQAPKLRSELVKLRFYFGAIAYKSEEATIK